MATKTPPWLLVASAATLILALLFMMGLVLVATLWNKQVPSESRDLLVIVLALAAGFGAAGLGGEAAAKGHIPVEGLDKHPMAVRFTGGIAVFFAVFLMRNYIVPPERNGPTLKLDAISGEETSQSPPRVLVTATFDGFHVEPGTRARIELCRDARCQDVTRAERIDDPLAGTMMVFLRAERDSLKAGRLVLENPSTNDVRRGSPVAISW